MSLSIPQAGKKSKRRPGEDDLKNGEGEGAAQEGMCSPSRTGADANARRRGVESPGFAVLPDREKHSACNTRSRSGVWLISGDAGIDTCGRWGGSRGGIPGDS